MAFLSSMYVSYSYTRQHMSRPHCPEILVGLSDRLCSLAMRIDTGSNFSR